jgi:hypothetical protein
VLQVLWMFLILFVFFAQRFFWSFFFPVQAMSPVMWVALNALFHLLVTGCQFIVSIAVVTTFTYNNNNSSETTKKLLVGADDTIPIMRIMGLAIVAAICIIMMEFIRDVTLIPFVFLFIVNPRDIAATDHDSPLTPFTLTSLFGLVALAVNRGLRDYLNHYRPLLLNSTYFQIACHLPMIFGDLWCILLCSLYYDELVHHERYKHITSIFTLVTLILSIMDVLISLCSMCVLNRSLRNDLHNPLVENQ